MVKLIALDLDGTLLKNDKTVSLENKRALQQAMAKGIYVVLCTGRPIMGIQHLIDFLEFPANNDYVITFNGALVQRATTREILSKKPHTLADVRYIYDTLMDSDLPMNAIDLQKVYEPPYPVDSPSQYPVIIKNLTFEHKAWDTFSDEATFNKALCCRPETELDSKLKTVPSEFFERFNTFKSRPELLEIMPKGVDKAFGIRRLCDLLGIEMADVMAIGDEENDIPMLKAVGYSVAMGNATQAVKEIAKIETLTNEENGVAYAVEKYVLNR